MIREIFSKIKFNIKKYGYKETFQKCIYRLLFGKRFFKKLTLRDYKRWIKINEPNKREIANQPKFKFDKMPKISIIVPMYNTKKIFLKDIIHCMQKQTYSNWELCLADGSKEENLDFKKYFENDERIKYKHLEKNDGISANTNEALKMISGDYVGLLDHDDVLPVFALFEIVKCINENPNVEFIYTDEDKINNKGKRFDPYFKSDFAPDTLRSQNYICHFSIFKKEFIEKLKGFRSEYDGAQDYDIFLRMTEIVKPNNIIHIPKILYHWRFHKESTAMDVNSKKWAFEAGKNAIQDHINRIGLKGNVEDGRALGIYKTIYDVIGKPQISILIPNKDGKDALEKCINSIINKSTYDNYEIVIIENNSEKKETFEYYNKLKENEKIKILYFTDKEFNYSKIINYGVKNSDGEYIVQLNNDTEILTNNWIEIMLGYCQRKEIGAVGVKLLYPDDTVQHAGVLLGLGGIAGHYFKFIRREETGYFSRANMTQNITAVTAACMMARRDVYEEVGYMNEELAVAFNDIDFCMKLRKKGYLNIYTPDVELYHYESKTRGEENTPEKVKRFNSEIETFKKYWQKELDEGDPYYNINLRLDNDQCAIRTDKIER